jgi:hypothetical protein
MNWSAISAKPGTLLRDSSKLITGGYPLNDE